MEDKLLPFLLIWFKHFEAEFEPIDVIMDDQIEAVPQMHII